jgi:hypothetical protein
MAFLVYGGLIIFLIVLFILVKNVLEYEKYW